MIEFQQLLEFKKNTEAIKKYIYGCKVKLNLTRVVVSAKDKNIAKNILNKSAGKSIKEIIDILMEEERIFRGDLEQYDDLTILGGGKEKVNILIITNKVINFKKIIKIFFYF